MSPSPEIPAADRAAAERGPVVFFDGECRLCRGFVAFALKRDRGRRFRFVSLQSDEARCALADHGIEPANCGTVLVLDGARLLKRSDAVVAVMRGLPGLWRLAAIVRFIPRPIRDGIYGFVARNRHRWFGRGTGP